MHSTICSFLALLSASMPALAQIDTLATLSAFPLQEGNRWQYEVTVYPYNGLPYDAGHHEISVGGEVLAPNGERYVELHGLDWNLGSFYADAVSWVRLDSTSLAVMQYNDFELYSCENDEERLLELVLGEGLIEYETCARQVEASSSVQVLPDWEYEAIGLDYYFPWSYSITLMRGLGVVGGSFGDLGFSTLAINYAHVNGLTWGDWVGVAEESQRDPAGFSLQTWPNPFNPEAHIRYDLPQPAVVDVYVHNLLGQRVVTLAEGPQGSGPHEAVFNGSGLASGLYIVSLEAAGRVESRRMLLAR